MAIVKMSEFNLLTFDDQKEELLKNLQTFNYVHFTNQNLDETGEKDPEAKSAKLPEEVVSVNEDLEKVKNAMRLLHSYDERPGGLKGMMTGNPNIDFQELEVLAKSNGWREIYDKISQISSKMDNLRVNETKMRSDLEEASEWAELDLSPAELSKLKVADAILGSVPKKLSDALYKDITSLDLSYVERVGETKTDNFFLIFSHDSEKEKLADILRNHAFSELKLDYDEIPLKRKQRIQKEIIELKALENSTREELRVYGKDLPKFELAYEYLNNKLGRLTANENFIKTDFMNVISGFIPTEKKEEFEEVVKSTVGSNYSLETKAADKDDPEVPIMLKNNKFNSAFENITSMYALPNYNELDPTPLLAPFYAIFFGMMIGDAGYGLLLLIGTTIALKKFNLSASMKKNISFFRYLSIPTIFWGVMYGSYFSLDIPVWKLLNPSVDFQVMLIMAMAFGIIHLFFGLGIKAYLLLRDGKTMDMVFDVLFWYMALTGGIVMLLSMFMTGIPPIVSTIAKIVMIIGMVGIVLFAARDSKGWGGRLAGGLYSLYGISSWVGDIVSYSRLMALGLAGGFIGMAFNMIGGMLGSTWFLIPAAIVMYVVGHLFNLFLSALGAYVHSMRLIYVEYFGKFYSGGGKKFNNLRKDPKYINYTESETI